METNSRNLRQSQRRRAQRTTKVTRHQETMTCARFESVASPCTCATPPATFHCSCKAGCRVSRSGCSHKRVPVTLSRIAFVNLRVSAHRFALRLGMAPRLFREAARSASLCLQALPDNLMDSLHQASEATTLAIDRGIQRCIIEILLPEFWDPMSGAVFSEEGDQMRFWQLGRRFCDDLIKMTDSKDVTLVRHRQSVTSHSADPLCLTTPLRSLQVSHPLRILAVVPSCNESVLSRRCL